MFKIVRFAGGSRVLTYCDQCHGRIDTAAGGVYAWRRDTLLADAGEGMEQSPEGGEMAVLHKGECHSAWEATTGHWQPWGELSWFPIFVANNMGMDWERTVGSLQNIAQLSREGA